MNQPSARRPADPLPHGPVRRRVLAAALAAAFGQAPAVAWGQVLPAGAQVVNGTADISRESERMVIRNSPNAILNWQSFSIGQANTVIFMQDNAASKVLNRVVGNDPSNILGSLSSNGQVWLVNPNGVLFGPQAQVNVGALVASTLGIANQDFLAGRFKFGADGVSGGVLQNQGKLSAGGDGTSSLGGHVWLIGGALSNDASGVVQGGQIVLAAGQSVELVDSAVPNVTVRVSGGANAVVNLGQLLAPNGGSVDLHGAMVNQNGIVRATSLDTGKVGHILIHASGDANLGVGSETSANGGDSAAGGQVAVESEGGTTLVEGRLLATSAGQGGGQIELRGPDVRVDAVSTIDASGAAGGAISIGTAPGTHGVAIGAEATLDASATGSGNGGSIVVRSDGTTSVAGVLQARGAAAGSQGGSVETSGALLHVSAAPITRGSGSTGGAWLLKAHDIAVRADDCSDCTPPPNQPSIVTSTVLQDALMQGAQVRLEADGGVGQGQGSVAVDASIAAGGQARPGAMLTLAANNDVSFGLGVNIGQRGTRLPVSAIADLDGNGAGDIRLIGEVSIFTGGADLRLGGGGGGSGGGSGSGSAQLVSLSGSELDAGSGSLYINAATLTNTGDSAMKGGAIGIHAVTLGLQNLVLDTSGRGAGASGSTVITGDSVSFTNTQVNADSTLQVVGASTIALDHTKLSAAGSGDAITLSTANLSAQQSGLTTPNGRWLAYLDGIAALSPALLRSLDYGFVQVDAGAYAKPTRAADNKNGFIVRAPLDVIVNVDATRAYDGTTGAAFSQALGSDLAPQFTLQNRSGPLQNGAFADKNAGAGKSVAVDGAATPFAIATSTGQPVYGANETYVADITPRLLTFEGVTALDKVYDGTRAATLSGSPAGILAGDAVSVSGVTGRFADKNAGAGKTVSITGATLAGLDAGNYALDGSGTAQASITPRPITLGGVTALDKVYDGTRAAIVSGSPAGILAGDVVTLTGASGLFDSKNVGAAKTVAISGTLGGADAANYSVALPAFATAAISARPLEIALTGEVRKEYDANTQASLAADGFRLDGVVAGDSVAVRGPAQGSFATADAGRAKPVSASGAFEISGPDAANYRIGATALSGVSNTVQATASGDVGTITPATLFYQASPATGVSGLPGAALGGSVTGFKGGDTLASATSGSVQWSSAATPASGPGAYAVVGSGLSAANYVFAQAPGNATALELKPGLAPGAPQQRLQDDSAQAIDSALHAAAPAIVSAATAQALSGAVFDRSTVAPAKTFEAIRIGSMSQDELARLIAYRRDFKRKLFADAIYKLTIDPSLADVRACNTAAEAASGTCRITPAQVAARQAAAVHAAAPARPRVVNLPRIERKIAVLFGINDYADKNIPYLINAVPDVEAIGKIFADKLGYEVRVVRNPDKATLFRTLNALALEAGSADSVAIYYAGHGYSMRKTGAGYWIPADASITDPKSWISNSDVAQLLSGIRSKQMTLISDSCYSGTFAREGLGAIGQHVTADDVLAKRSVVVLSSGGDEPVPDSGREGHSIFAWHLMRVIGAVNDWKQGSTIFADVQARVKKEFPQTPTYGSLTAAGHQAGGDYLFESRSN